jgi:predicted TIM-barrel fold metal-dependent hydrolase
MPLQDHMKLISVDDHLFEHGRVWLDRVPSKYNEIAPQLFDTGKVEYWTYEDKITPAFIMMSAPAGHPREEYGMGAVHSSNVLPGCMDPVARLADMDLDGLWASVCFPSYARFAGTQFLEGKDKELALLCVQAYNDFVLDEWCAAAPDRYIPMGILPLWDRKLAAQEVERIAGRGMKAIAFPENMVPLGLPTWHTGEWDPVFAAAQETGLPLNIHIGTSGSLPKPGPASPEPVYISLMACSSMSTAADLCFSHIFHTFPRLNVALSEGGIGWIPYLLERMDYVWERDMYWTGVNKLVPPSEIFREHIYGCFIDDMVGIRERNSVGIKNLLLESDYPHADTSWPDTRKRAQEVLLDVPDEEAHRIAELNARDLYNFHATT